jgi:hypothetical protein
MKLPVTLRITLAGFTAATLLMGIVAFFPAEISSTGSKRDLALIELAMWILGLSTLPLVLTGVWYGILHWNGFERSVERSKVPKDKVYAERNLLVCALSKLFPSYLHRHTDKELEDMGWDEGRGWVVYIQIPVGQLSWYIRTEELELFDHLDRRADGGYDGHSTEEKYDRLTNIGARVSGTK